MKSWSNVQREIAQKYDAQYVPCQGHLKVGLSRSIDSKTFPINGLRHPPEGDTTGWYIWSGEKFSADAKFFVPIHALHLDARCPAIVKYLGLGPGWRFLLAPGQEEVWFDADLLKV